MFSFFFTVGRSGSEQHHLEKLNHWRIMGVEFLHIRGVRWPLGIDNLGASLKKTHTETRNHMQIQRYFS